MGHARLERFMGSGNCWIADGKYRGWKIVCSRCDAVKTIHSRGSSWPPHVIIQKLSQAGWSVANNAKDDLCPGCRAIAKPKTDVGFATKALIDALKAPVVQSHGVHLHFNDIVAICKTLPAVQAKELIAVLRDRLPKSVPRAPKVAPPINTDDDYEKWLNEQPIPTEQT